MSVSYSYVPLYIEIAVKTEYILIW